MDIRLYESICFPVCGFYLAIFLLIIYITKSKTVKISYRYIVSIIVCSLMIFLEILNPTLIMNMDKNIKLYTFLLRLLPLTILIYRIQTLLIVSMATSKNGKEYNGNKMAKYATYILGYGASIVLAFSLPIEFVNIEGFPLATRGFIMTFSDIFAAVISIIELILLMKSNSSHNKMALAPFIFLMMIYIISNIYQVKYNVYLNVAGTLNIILLLISYMTFENQDYKKLKQIMEDEKNINRSNKVKDEELNKIYYDIRTEVSTILDYCKINQENKENSEEMFDESIKGINNSIKNLDSIASTMKDGVDNEI